MKGEEKYLVKLLQGADKRFIIPVYQRNYNWNLDQCKQMFSDLLDLAKDKENSHFFGSVVSKADMDKRIVIDGQQRITTSFLFLLALKRAIEDKAIVCHKDNLADKINRTYLIDEFDDSELKLKLKLIKSDQHALESLFKGDEDFYYYDSNVTQNYIYFYKEITSIDINADKIAEAFRKFLVIDIKLSSEDDAQRIFESLNSTGLELNEGDKVRNYILMGLDPDTQNDYYEKYWKKIEYNTMLNKQYDVSAFLRFWLAAVRRKIPNIKNVYYVYKEYVKSHDYSSEYVLKELLKYSNFYSYIIHGNTGFPEIDHLLKRFKNLESTAAYPFMLNLFNYFYEDEVLDEKEQRNLIEILQVLETYIFRRWVCGVAANALNKIFATLHNDVMKWLNDTTEYVEIMKRILLDKDVSGRFPCDEEFIENIKKRDFYRIFRYKYYLYDRLENQDSKERVNVIKNMVEGNFSVEHIMPQKLSPIWESDLGPNAHEIHDKWLNNIANLTITAYNSEYSNKPFKDKLYNKNQTGFCQSNLRINDYVKNQTEWTEKQLEERLDIMVNLFISLWPMAESSFEWPKPQTLSYSLADEHELTGTCIYGFSFLNKSFEVESWKEMICAVILMVYELNPTVIESLINGDNEFPSSYFTNKPNLENFVHIKNNVYFYPNVPTTTKLEILKAVFAQANIDESELVFEVI